MKILYKTLVLAACLVLTFGCRRADGPVLYASTDHVYAVEIIRAFEKETGLRVQLVTDSESNKGAHLTARLIEEKGRPVADVYWNNEISRTLLLAKKGVLAPYKSPAAADIPEKYADPGGLWTAFSARARVIVYNTEKVKPADAPRSILDLAYTKWKGKVAFANPVAGTTASHASALFLVLGEKRAMKFFTKLKANGARMVASNSQVRDMVARGEALVGLTDTDDVWAGVESRKPVAMVYPDRETFGTLVIPNSVMLVKGGPHPELGKRLVDFLLRKKTEEMLAKGRARQIPVRRDVPVPEGVKTLGEIRCMDLDFSAISENMESACLKVRGIFQK